MTKIKATKLGEGFYSDGSGLEELKANFKSEVYASFDEYMMDLGLRSRNENFHGELPFVTESNKPRRSAEERNAILVKKIEAQRRFDKHIETGGTEVLLGGLPDILNTKKASH